MLCWPSSARMRVRSKTRTPVVTVTGSPSWFMVGASLLQKRLGDFAPVYEINAYTQDERAAQATLTRLLAAVQDVFAERGVQIMTPNYVADPAQAKIPPRPT